jgi:hypothetical protein
VRFICSMMSWLRYSAFRAVKFWCFHRIFLFVKGWVVFLIIWGFVGRLILTFLCEVVEVDFYGGNIYVVVRSSVIFLLIVKIEGNMFFVYC